jgi:hypothetical protein
MLKIKKDTKVAVTAGITAAKLLTQQEFARGNWGCQQGFKVRVVFSQTTTVGGDRSGMISGIITKEHEWLSMYTWVHSLAFMPPQSVCR